MQYYLDIASMLNYRLRMLEIILIITLGGSLAIAYCGIMATLD